jgi:hypothetical protein
LNLVNVSGEIYVVVREKTDLGWKRHCQSWMNRSS